MRENRYLTDRWLRSPLIQPLRLLLLMMLIVEPASALPTIEHWQTHNGARVYFVAARQLPMVDIRIIFDAAAARDGEQPGIALLTNALLAEGAGSLTADQIADQFAAVGAVFGNESLRDMAIVRLRTLTESAAQQQAVSTLAQLLEQPNFAPAAVERERRRMRVALQQQQQSPDDVAERLFYQALYGDHPYGHAVLGDEQSLLSITPAQLQQFHQRYYVGRNAVVALVGDLDRTAAEALAEALVGALPAGEAAAPLPTVPALAAARQITRSHPSTQTHILIGQPGIRRADSDYIPLYVGNHILGGSGLVSRISQRIREEHGLAYSSYSYFLPMQQQGPLLLGLQTANRNREQAQQLLHQTLQRFVSDGPTDEELVRAKQNIRGGFALNLDSNAEMVRYLATIGFYRLPLDYLQRYLERVDAVSVAQVQAAFRRHVNPDRLVTVRVGAAPDGGSE